MVGALKGYAGFQAIKEILRKNKDLVSLGVLKAKELADAYINDQHIKIIIKEFNTKSEQGMSDDQEVEEFEKSLGKRIDELAKEFTNIKKEDLEKLKYEKEESEKKLKDAVKKEGMADFARKQIRDQLRKEREKRR